MTREQIRALIDVLKAAEWRDEAQAKLNEAVAHAHFTDCSVQVIQGVIDRDGQAPPTW